MAAQKQTQSGVISKLWTNWCSLDPTQRTQVAQKLGPMGQVLTIAANVHQFVNNSQHIFDADQNTTDSQPPSQDQKSNANSSKDEEEFVEADFIDAEFEEVDP